MTTTTLLISTLPTLLAPAPEAAESLPPVTPTLLMQEKADTGWSGSINAGFTHTQGNTETLTANLDANAERTVAETHRYSGKLFYVYGEQSSELSERKAGISVQYDWLAGERHYYFLTAGAETDELANIDLRYFGGGGVGYQFYDTDEFDFAGELGLTYFREEYDVRQPAPPAKQFEEDDSTVTFKVAYDLDWILSEKTEFLQDFEAYPAVDDLSDVFLRLDSRLVTHLTERMTGSAQYVLDWDNTPAAGAKRDDHRFVLALGWAFGG